ncbi:MAG: hypothetical protein HOB41_17515 [Gemmatimonadetes bacterium]|nr:hypothetical protein [Gemmatimonadota bacterium]MBT7548614.1 hypothetical protein [Gemmatimonadota bacterium]
MALGLSYCCDCGMKYKVYTPKRNLLGGIITPVVDWREVDAREEADGEIEEVQRL